MRHFDFIKDHGNVNPSTVTCNRAIREILSRELKWSREDSLKSESYVVGTFVSLSGDSCFNSWGDPVRNYTYPHCVGGITTYRQPQERELRDHYLITSGTTYVLLDVNNKLCLVESDHAFSAV